MSPIPQMPQIRSQATSLSCRGRQDGGRRPRKPDPQPCPVGVDEEGNLKMKVTIMIMPENAGAVIGHRGDHVAAVRQETGALVHVCDPDYDKGAQLQPRLSLETFPAGRPLEPGSFPSVPAQVPPQTRLKRGSVRGSMLARCPPAAPRNTKREPCDEALIRSANRSSRGQRVEPPRQYLRLCITLGKPSVPLAVPADQLHEQDHSSPGLQAHAIVFATSLRA